VTDEQYTRGMRVSRELLGDAFVDALLANRTDFNGPFFDYVTGAVWSDVWARDGLDRRTRSCITLAILTALGREDEIALHIEVALRNGLTTDDIREVLLHTAPYAGVPLARGAVLVAEKTLERLATEVGE
jgi:4-carboxymuconolactone decarboxylase